MVDLSEYNRFQGNKGEFTGTSKAINYVIVKELAEVFSTKIICSRAFRPQSIIIFLKI